ncbi:MAG: hypothetical protein JNK82_03880 [Myxococcaceae bacterium]|nr:hypothetical protein [Myxococcaceae bacterium]
MLATRCFFINYVPIVPLGTYRLVGGRAGPVSFSLKSVFAAMFKVWGFIGAGAIAAYGIGYHSWDERHPEMPFITLLAGLLFLGVYTSWLFLGHRARTRLRWGVVSGLALITVAVLVLSAVANHEGAARVTQSDGTALPPADLPMSISVMKNVPGALKDEQLNPVASGALLKQGQPVLVDLPNGTAMALVAADTTSAMVKVTTKSGGSKVYQVDRARLYVARR